MPHLEFETWTREIQFQHVLYIELNENICNGFLECDLVGLQLIALFNVQPLIKAIPDCGQVV